MAQLLRALAAIGALVIGAVALYLAVAVVLGALSVNHGFSESPDGVTVYVRTNGVHADLVMPTRNEVFDWSGALGAAAEEADAWTAVGWGDRDFLLHTPTWADLRPMTALRALAGVGEGALHVQAIDLPHRYQVRRVRISAEQYAELARYVNASFARAADGQPIRIAGQNGDAYFASTQRYRLWFTSNEWTRRALAAAGIRVPLWAPFDIAIFLHLDPTTEAE